jgi:hypothetical protein
MLRIYHYSTVIFFNIVDRCITCPSLEMPSLFKGLSRGAKSPLRLIDVKDQCVIEAHTPLRYFALSYTWWQYVEQVKLKFGTLSQFMTKEGLAQEKLPKTIKDAMTLTSRLGERYLWVDVLCIIQDDTEDNSDKRIQMERMCTIYTNAILTIIAGEGKDADAGLSRVNDYAGPPFPTHCFANIHSSFATNIHPTFATNAHHFCFNYTHLLTLITGTLTMLLPPRCYYLTVAVTSLLLSLRSPG